MIQHVTREVLPTALDDCVAFYGALGFAPVPTPTSLGSRAVWLQRGTTQVHLMPKPDAVVQSGHIGVVVDAYEGTVERLQARGYEVEPRQQHWGSPRAYVRDPAGNLVEIMAWPPQTPASR